MRGPTGPQTQPPLANSERVQEPTSRSAPRPGPAPISTPHPAHVPPTGAPHPGRCRPRRCSVAAPEGSGPPRPLQGDRPAPPRLPPPSHPPRPGDCCRQSTRAGPSAWRIALPIRPPVATRARHCVAADKEPRTAACPAVCLAASQRLPAQRRCPLPDAPADTISPVKARLHLPLPTGRWRGRRWGCVRERGRARKHGSFDRSRCTPRHPCGDIL